MTALYHEQGVFNLAHLPDHVAHAMTALSAVSTDAGNALHTVLSHLKVWALVCLPGPMCTSVQW